LPEIEDAYLRRLGLDREPPTVEALFRIHRAHLERVPYETTWIHLGEQWTVDPQAAMARVALGGRGGYCFHLNGSLSQLLASLGYDVTLHIGGVHGPEPVLDNLTNHLVLTVAGLPSDENPGGRWYVDAGLGDALYEPLPLIAGTYRQDPHTFVLTETPGGIGDWHFAHDPKGSFPGMNFTSDAATIDAFAARHQRLSTSPDSGFVRNVTAQRRHRKGVSALRSLGYTELDTTGSTTRIITDRAEWFELLADEFALRFDGVDVAAKDRLWASACASHEAWLAAHAGSEVSAADADDADASAHGSG
jgi:arylamine N-acetyltransferase